MATGDRPYQSQSEGIVIGMHELERLRKKFADVADQLTGDTELASRIGQQQVDAARNRIRYTKRAPNGKRWEPWSEKYRATREGRHSLLVNEGKMADELDYDVPNPLEVHVGSPVPYFRAHLFGNRARGLPARPALDNQPGFADPSDRREIRDILRDIWNREVKKKR